jgi:hypothetical protein
VTISIEPWQLLTALGSLFALFGGLGKFLLVQIQKSLDQRFGAVKERLEKVDRDTSAWQDLERDFLRFREEIAVHYVRREDYVRGQSVIEAKLDAIASEVKRVQIDSVKQGNVR